MYLRAKYEWEPVTLAPGASVVEAAEAMDAHGIGCVVVAEADCQPVGVLTDRDLARRVIAAGLDAASTRVADVMTVNPVTAPKDTPVAELLDLMRVRGVRRLPLTGGGKLVGVISLDDLMLTLAVELWNVAEGVREELRETWRTSAKRRRQESRGEILEDLRDRVLASGAEIRDRTARELRALADRISG